MTAISRQLGVSMTDLTDDVLARFSAIPTSTICDAAIKAHIRPPEKMVIPGVAPVQPRPVSAVGRARTERRVLVRDPERSSLVSNRALATRLTDEASPGDFLVITAPAGPPFAVFGGMMALKASLRGVTGVVTDGLTRDVAEIIDHNLPTWAAGITPIAGGYGGYSIAQVNEPVNCGGIEVLAGDLIVADSDGVVVIPAGQALELLAVCEEMDTAEQATAKALAAGANMAEAYPSRSYYTDSSAS
jgi:regulator of RNase E activity RraA